MKLLHAVYMLGIGSSLLLGAQLASATDLIIHGKQAKLLYNSLTGPAVQHDGAAGHLYSKGTSILCRYTDADMTKNGKAVPATCSSRYACSMTFSPDGLASPGPNP